MTEAIAEVFPEAAYQRCTAHFYRSVLAKVPKSKRAEVAAMPEAVHAQESLSASMGKADAVAATLDDMKLAAAASCVREGAAETLTYNRFPMRHWRHIRTNNAIERLNREIRRRAGGRHLPGRQERAHVGNRQTQVRGRQRMGLEEVSGCHAVGRVVMPKRIGRLDQSTQDY